MAYPSFPIQYQPNGVPVGLIPVELDIEGIYEDHDRRRRKGGNDKVVASHVHSVSGSSIYRANMILIPHSVAEPKTELLNELSGIGKRNTCGNSSNDWRSLKVVTVSYRGHMSHCKWSIRASSRNWNACVKGSPIPNVRYQAYRKISSSLISGAGMNPRWKVWIRCYSTSLRFVLIRRRVDRNPRNRL